MLADKEAEFAAAKEAIKLRYEQSSRSRRRKCQRLSLKCRPKSSKRLTTDFEQLKAQLTSLERLHLMSETDYRNCRVKYANSLPLVWARKL
jgi:hypothetical protein